MFLLDTSVFIQCHNFNPPQVFRSFWEWFETNDLGVRSIDAVFREIDPQNEWLITWARDRRKDGFFLDNEAEEVQQHLRNIANYTSKHYRDSVERDKFLNGADPWLIASALSWNWEILTFEKPVGPNSQKPKIPNIASHFEVKTSNFFHFLNNHNISF